MNNKLSLKRKFKSLFESLVILLSFWGTNVYGQTVFVVLDGSAPASVGEHFEFLVDGGDMTAEKAAVNIRFKKAVKRVMSFTTDSTIIGRIKLTAATEGDYYLKFDPPTLKNFSVFQKRGAAKWTEVRSGWIVRPEEKDVPVSHPFIKLDIWPGDTTDLIVMIRERVPVNLDLKIGRAETFFQAFQTTDMYNGVCMGIILMMCIYNIFLFVTQREKEYLWYVLYLAMTLIILPFSVLGYNIYFPRFMVELNSVSTSFFSCGPIIFLLLFIMELFRGMLPRWLIVLNYCFVVSAMVAIITGALGLEEISVQIVLVQNMLIIVPCILAGIFALHGKHSGALYYLIGYGVFLTGFTALILSFLGLVDNDLMVGIKMHTAGTAFECVLLSFALGNKLKVSQKEKEKAQAESLVQSMKNERLIKEQNALLEQKVKERTAEVVAQKQVIEEKHKEITDSIRYARRIQSSLLPTEKYIEHKLKDRGRK